MLAQKPKFAQKILVRLMDAERADRVDRSENMQGSKKHHHVPVFYLSRWCGDDGRVVVVRNITRKIVTSRRGPDYLGFEYSLYSYDDAFDAIDQSEIETKFFKPLDNEGARIVATMIAGMPMEKRDYILWAQFVAAMRIRTPENVVMIKNKYLEMLAQDMHSSQGEYETLRNHTDPTTPIGWLKLNRPGLLESFGIRQLPKIVSSPKVMQDILSLCWQIVNFDQSSTPLLTSDRPCVYTKGLANPDCVIALPLSPRHAFFAFRANSRVEHALRSVSISKLAKYLNDSVVSQAAARAYCPIPGQPPDSFFLRRLPQSA